MKRFVVDDGGGDEEFAVDDGGRDEEVCRRWRGMEVRCRGSPTFESGDVEVRRLFIVVGCQTLEMELNDGGGLPNVTERGLPNV